MYKKEFYIGKTKISKDSPVYFIADIAANHDGNLQRAKDLIYRAKEAGADSAKFQHFLANKIVSDYGFKHLIGGQSHQANWKKTVFQIYDDYHCKREWTEELINTCKNAEIEFMTTPYDFEAFELLDKYVNAYKIGSGDITWVDFLEMAAQMNKPILLACGASNMSDVKRALDVILKHNSEVALMQCNTNYTASIENYKYINLNTLKTFEEEYPGMIFRLSDHTFGHSTVLGAVALGAKIIEKHFTDDNTRTGPDHKFAMNPNTWREMVDRTRELELALGDGIKRIEYNENDTVVVQRRCARLRHDMEAGTVIHENDIEFLRPAPINSFYPYEKHELIGRKLTISKNAGDCILKGELLE